MAKVVFISLCNIITPMSPTLISYQFQHESALIGPYDLQNENDI